MAEQQQGQAVIEQPQNPFAAMQAVALRMIQAEEGSPSESSAAAPQAQAPDAQSQQPPEGEEAQQPATAAEVRKHKLIVKAEDGTDEEVEVDDEGLKKGFMLERAFRMKTAKLARDREALEANVQQELGKKLKEYDDKLQLAEQAIWHTLAPEIQQVDWNKLAQENPAEWAQRYQHVQSVNARLAQVQAERQRIVKAQSEEAQKAFRKAAETSLETLKTDIPGWSDELYGKILKTGMQYGFKAEEVNAIVDHRALKVLHDAMLYRELKAKPPGDKKIVEVPKVAKPGTTAAPSDPNADKWKEGMAKLRKTGHRNDAVPVMMEYLRREGSVR